METDLSRFIEAQKFAYLAALQEIRAGKKRNHWMWFIFPQILGLGQSEMSIKYAIRDVDEARAYLNHEILGNRLREITGVLLTLKTSDAREVFGYPDNLKLRSCMTLFALIDEPDSLFQQVLNKYFSGSTDNKTLRLAGANPSDTEL